MPTTPTLSAPTAQKIGSKYGLITVGIGILMAQFIMTFMMSIGESHWWSRFFWFTDTPFLPNVLVGVAVVLFLGHYFGQMAGKAILLQKRHPILVGVLTGAAIVATTMFLVGWIEFFQAYSTDDEAFTNYILKPVYWVLVFGFFPILALGTWFGYSIRRAGKHLTT